MAGRVVRVAAVLSVAAMPIWKVDAAHVRWCGRFFVTGYVDRGLTATGVRAGPGSVAVDPSVIPLRSYVRVDGIGTLRAMDTGGAIVGMRLDVWVGTVARAYAITGPRRACVIGGSTHAGPGA
jgi:3D (Asp-Asp-Asp) domain-containing protein